MEPRRRFRFLKELSEGAFGKVYLAEMVTGDNFSSVVAIKLLHGKWQGHTEIVQRSRDEARVLGLLHHPNIVRVEDLTSINGQCAVIMEFLEGVDLKTLINWCVEHEIPFPRRVAFEVVAEIASALEAAYNRPPLQGGEPLRLIHRDIKPSNVMLTVSADVKVLDFGTAQARFDQREAKTQALAFGSAAYMAPERLLGDPDAPSGDVYSLGVTLYELLALKGFGKIHIRPEKHDTAVQERVDGIDLSDLDDDIAEQVRTALKLMLSYEPEDRPTASQVVELMEALAEAVNDGSKRRFCREVVKSCREARESEGSASDDPLTGSTLFEDITSLGSAGGFDLGDEAIEEESSVDVEMPLESSAGESSGSLRDKPPEADDSPEAPADHSGSMPSEGGVEAAASSPVEAGAPPEPVVESPAGDAVPLPSDEAVAKKSGTGKLVLVAAVLVAVVLGGGGFAVSRVLGAGKDGADQDVSGEVHKVPANAVPGGMITVGEVGADAGTLVLTLQPPGKAFVSITSFTGFKKDWDGTGKLEIVGLPSGTYRTKISPLQGRSVRNTVEVEANKSCSYVFSLGGGQEWKRLSCE